MDDLKRFLENKGLEHFRAALKKNGIKNLTAFMHTWADNDSKQAVLKELKGDSPKPVLKGLYATLEAVTVAEIKEFLNPAKPEPPPKAPEANTQLREYLEKKGLDETTIALVAKHGGTSLQAFQALCADDNLKTTVRGEITTHKQVMADLFDRIDPENVQTTIDALFNPVVDEAVRNAQIDERRVALTEAIAAVERQRQEIAGSAEQNMATVQQLVAEKLHAVIQKADISKLMGRLEKRDFADIASLNSALAEASNGISKDIERQILASQKNVEHLSDLQLCKRLCVFRGFHMTANKVEASLSLDLLSMEPTLRNPTEFSDTNFDYTSQSSYDYAQSTVEQSSSSFSAQQSASGAAFIGDGIGALSVAGGYANSTAQYEAKALAARINQSTHIKVRKIRQPTKVVELPPTKLALSRAASKELNRIATLADPSRERQVLAFLKEYGSHVFLRVVLGGCFKVVATACASSREEISRLDTALSKAFQWNASMSGTYYGISGVGSTSSGNAGAEDASHASSNWAHETHLKQEIKLATVVSGGIQNLSVDLWKASLGKNPFWAVLDHEEAVAIWQILENPGIADIPAEKLSALRRELEQAWVQKIFVPSLPKTLRDRPSLQQARTCTELEDALRRETEPPAMDIRVFRRSYGKAQHFRETLELGEGFKILSGGVAALGDAVGNFVVSSYPSWNSATKCWSWKAAMKDVQNIAEADHEIRIVALYDPTDKWDVKIFENKTTRPEVNHVVAVNVADGYVLTGGGAQIDLFSRSVLTGCGPYPDDSAPPQFTSFRASSSSIGDENHSITGYAIGIKPNNDAVFEPANYSESYKDPKDGLQHHDRTIKHQAKGVCVGGGAFLLPRVPANAHSEVAHNYLTACLPALDSDGQYVTGWTAASKDHAGFVAAADMVIGTVGLPSPCKT